MSGCVMKGTSYKSCSSYSPSLMYGEPQANFLEKSWIGGTNETD